MIQHVHTNNLDHVVSWERDGTAIKVHLPQEFEQSVMPIFFTQIRFKSFQRQLLQHGFVRIQGGDDKNCYINKKFTIQTCEHEDGLDDVEEGTEQDEDGSCCSSESIMKDCLEGIVPPTATDSGANDDLLKDVEEATIAIADDATAAVVLELAADTDADTTATDKSDSNSSSIPLSITCCNNGGGRRRFSLSTTDGCAGLLLAEDPFEKLLDMVHDPFPTISMKLI